MYKKAEGKSNKISSKLFCVDCSCITFSRVKTRLPVAQRPSKAHAC